VDVSAGTVFDPDLSNNTASEETEIIGGEYPAPEMVYPQDGQVLGWGCDQSYMFKVDLPEDAVGFEYKFIQNGKIIHEDSSQDLTGEFAVHPDHPKHDLFEEGYVEVRIRAELESGFYTEERIITIILVDLWNLEVPVLIEPSQDVLVMDNDYTFKVNPTLGARGYSFRFFQNGRLVYEEYTTKTEIELYLGRRTFVEGPVQIRIRALVGNNWSDTSIVNKTIIIKPTPP